jgi:hypothetical protein
MTEAADFGGDCMTVLINPKHERFALALAEGKTQLEAYAGAGYRPDDGAANRLSGNIRVKARVRELQERAAAKAECTIADIARQLDEDRAFARELQNPSAAISSTMGKAKVLGLIVDKSELAGKAGAPVQIEQVTADAESFMRRIAALADRAAGG